MRSACTRRNCGAGVGLGIMVARCAAVHGELTDRSVRSPFQPIKDGLERERWEACS